MSLTLRQSIFMSLLRFSLGMLLVWWGIGRILNPQMGMKIQEKFYFNLFPSESLQIAFGGIELCIGLLVALGLFRKFAVPGQLAITGFSALSITPALLDPFGLWLPFEKISAGQHLFYPSLISLFAGFFVYSMSRYDRFCLDALRPSNSAQTSSVMAAE